MMDFLYDYHFTFLYNVIVVILTYGIYEKSKGSYGEKIMDNITRRNGAMAYISDNKVLMQQFKSKLLQKCYNHSIPFNIPKWNALMKLMGIKHKGKCIIEPPFRCDYGFNIEIGDNFYANSGMIILDVVKVKIGDNVMFGPNAALITAGHPIHPDCRNSRYEYGKPITVGSNVWFGANVTVVPGVNIGSGCVIGAGSVVTKDMPDNTVCAGNPCRVIRHITEDERKYLFKKERFDAEAWENIKKMYNWTDDGEDVKEEACKE